MPRPRAEKQAAIVKATSAADVPAKLRAKEMGMFENHKNIYSTLEKDGEYIKQMGKDMPAFWNKAIPLGDNHPVAGNYVAAGAVLIFFNGLAAKLPAGAATSSGVGLFGIVFLLLAYDPKSGNTIPFYPYKSDPGPYQGGKAFQRFFRSFADSYRRWQPAMKAKNVGNFVAAGAVLLCGNAFAASFGTGNGNTWGGFAFLAVVFLLLRGEAKENTSTYVPNYSGFKAPWDKKKTLKPSKTRTVKVKAAAPAAATTKVAAEPAAAEDDGAMENVQEAREWISAWKGKSQ